MIGQINNLVLYCDTSKDTEYTAEQFNNTKSNIEFLLNAGFNSLSTKNKIIDNKVISQEISMVKNKNAFIRNNCDELDAFLKEWKQEIITGDFSVYFFEQLNIYYQEQDIRGDNKSFDYYDILSFVYKFFNNNSMLLINYDDNDNTLNNRTVSAITAYVTMMDILYNIFLFIVVIMMIKLLCSCYNIVLLMGINIFVFYVLDKQDDSIIVEISSVILSIYFFIVYINFITNNISMVLNTIGLLISISLISISLFLLYVLINKEILINNSISLGKKIKEATDKFINQYQGGGVFNAEINSINDTQETKDDMKSDRDNSDSNSSIDKKIKSNQQFNSMTNDSVDNNDGEMKKKIMDEIFNDTIINDMA